MRQNIFSVYDNAAEAFINPFFLPEIAQAKRAFTDLVNDKEHLFGKHPEDYTLFHLGAFDNMNADFIMFDSPKSLGIGIEYKTQKEMFSDLTDEQIHTLIENDPDLKEERSMFHKNQTS